MQTALAARGGSTQRRRATRAPTFVAGLRDTGVVALFVVDGPLTGPILRAAAWPPARQAGPGIAEVLAPALQPGDVVVRDHRTAPKVKGAAILAAKAGLLDRPPDAPDPTRSSPSSPS